jgi:hypothetical protein
MVAAEYPCVVALVEPVTSALTRTWDYDHPHPHPHREGQSLSRTAWSMQHGSARRGLSTGARGPAEERQRSGQCARPLPRLPRRWSRQTRAVWREVVGCEEEVIGSWSWSGQTRLYLQDSLAGFAPVGGLTWAAPHQPVSEGRESTLLCGMGWNGSIGFRSRPRSVPLVRRS